MTTLFVLDIDDFRPLAKVAGKDPDVTVRRRGPYLEVAAPGSIRIERSATGCRNAVWYSSIAAVSGSRISRWDKSVLVVEPTGAGG
ncbi:hypothetical protein [Streptomyces rapamycinicus]|uniref:Uncharacterized protein n=2 Tax=Streptomyces rapamycinicus TaxID=1226757 RepID=A0A0A0N6F1_STRRN|nr:hypothetical protein [Streptomyces rapamycinicus]AGP52024.1 hypothetical protein M271_01945 [Streptomyces rapamycinicus NRRL 5491]MBB4779449.1 hypothetical protein [Streptomyces rapamycinicus]RLV75888.1 hypothetical protein D3C57_141720 [Streptomyces rapamycinicus NRRL 5491]UTP28220.1 hypothetical protein LIV37_01945 [Streptomyces rapamycinicus NRRL 5491]